MLGVPYLPEFQTKLGQTELSGFCLGDPLIKDLSTLTLTNSVSFSLITFS